jgi:sugar lactone lactonase YvrE
MTDTHVSIDILSDIPCELGESALWDDLSGRFYWVDILAQRIYAKDPAGGVTRELSTPDLVGSVGLRAGGGLVVALRHAVAFADIDAGTVESVVELETELDGNRFNDGAVDPGGRFWFGSMDLAETTATGAFYRLDPDLTVTRAFGDIICSNGPCWSPDGRTMYHVDSTRRSIRAYDCDPATASVGPPRVFVDDGAEAWFPDGVTVDAEGFIWNCKWAGGRLVRYAPDGTVDRALILPVPRPTRCAFIGPDLATLAVTSARVGLDAAELVDAPLSGQVLLLDPGVRGLVAPRFTG